MYVSRGLSLTHRDRGRVTVTPLVTLAGPEPLPPDLGGAGARGLAAAGHAQAVA